MKRFHDVLVQYAQQFETLETSLEEDENTINTGPRESNVEYLGKVEDNNTSQESSDKHVGNYFESLRTE